MRNIGLSCAATGACIMLVGLIVGPWVLLVSGGGMLLAGIALTFTEEAEAQPSAEDALNALVSMDGDDTID